MRFHGHALKLGEHINTDVIYPGKYLAIFEPEEMAKHAMEGLGEDVQKRLKGAIIVAGKNFGCGSSREQAATCLKYAGVKAIVAESFSRIFFRNGINQGIPLVQCSTSSINDADEIEILFKDGILRDITTGDELRFSILPDFLISVIEAGGLVEYMRGVKHG